MVASTAPAVKTMKPTLLPVKVSMQFTKKHKLFISRRESKDEEIFPAFVLNVRREFF